MTVYLVGAGPGSAELLTVKAARLLERADVVLYDRLVHESVLALAPDRATLVNVGKRVGDSGKQQLINARLIAYGRMHDCVVRLKGGDPFVFGRGGEEALALAQAGIAVEVVPGVSAAFAAPALGGVPVTQRGVATSVTVVAAQTEHGFDGGDWRALAALGGTIVVLMGCAVRSQLSTALIDAGRSPATPACIIEAAGRPAQRVIRCTLATLPAIDVAAPATIVIGEVANFDVLARSIESRVA